MCRVETILKELKERLDQIEWKQTTDEKREVIAEHAKNLLKSHYGDRIRIIGHHFKNDNVVISYHLVHKIVYIDMSIDLSVFE